LKPTMRANIKQCVALFLNKLVSRTYDMFVSLTCHSSIQFVLLATVI